MTLSGSILAQRAAGRLPVIPDFKRVSPKRGELFHGRDAAETARLLETLGAPGVSVVTEERDFGGSLELLREVAGAVSIPVLRKDFIRSAEDVALTAECGASAVLLICACMTERELSECFAAALDAGIEPLVETADESGLALAKELGAALVGINNRDILSLERDDGTVERTARLAAMKPEGAVLISESGIGTPAEARRAVLAGADAVLVGTALWEAPDIGRAYLEMCGG